MSRDEYMKQLEEKLQLFDAELQAEITEDYRQHFIEGISAGKTDAEIIEELGDVEEMIGELSAELKEEQAQLAAAPIQESFGDNCHTIQLDALMADVRVEASDDNRIYVTYQNNGGMKQQLAYSFYQYEEKGVFYAGIRRRPVEEVEQLHGIGKFLNLFAQELSGLGSSVQLLVKIPVNFPHVRIKTGSGDVGVKEISAASLMIGTGSGDVELKDAEAQKLEIQVGSGDISMKNAGFENGYLHSGSGDMEIDVPAEFTRGNITVHSGSGDIEMKSAIQNCSIQTGSGDIEYACLASVARIALQSGSGDMDITLKNATGMNLDIKSPFGDIDVQWKNDGTKRLNNGKYSFGDGSSCVSVMTGSGDVEIVGE